jgi:hypothetical protein
MLKNYTGLHKGLIMKSNIIFLPFFVLLISLNTLAVEVLDLPPELDYQVMDFDGENAIKLNLNNSERKINSLLVVPGVRPAYQRETPATYHRNMYPYPGKTPEDTSYFDTVKTQSKIIISPPLVSEGLTVFINSEEYEIIEPVISRFNRSGENMNIEITYTEDGHSLIGFKPYYENE